MLLAILCSALFIIILIAVAVYFIVKCCKKKKRSNAIGKAVKISPMLNTESVYGLNQKGGKG